MSEQSEQSTVEPEPPAPEDAPELYEPQGEPPPGAGPRPEPAPEQQPVPSEPSR
jgi:hypothetical protein